MAFDVIVPEVGEVGMEVVFVRWLKAEGDEVKVGDPLFEVDTEKSVMEVEAYADGVLSDLAVAEGDIIQTRQVIARILTGSEDDQPSAAAPAPTHVTPPPSGSAGTGGSSSPVPAAGSGGAVAERGPRRAGVSPRARRVARKLGVEIDGLVGSGPDGLVTEADVLGAAEAAQTASASPPDTDAVERARRVVADVTTRSWQTVPHFYLQLEADVQTGLESARPTPLICAATAQALVRHPECNLDWSGDTLARRDSVDLGLLVDAPSGLLVAVIRGAARLGLADMAEAIRAAAERARSGKLSTDDLGPRSLTVSNLGMYAVDRFDPVITKPDVMTLAAGRARTVPRWQGQAFTPRAVIDLTLAVDHRALDGAAAARFLSTLERILADPEGEGLR